MVLLTCLKAAEPRMLQIVRMNWQEMCGQHWPGWQESTR
jgi:hypothetical protein